MTKKSYSLHHFSQVSLSKDTLFELVERIRQDDEVVEIKVGETVFEGIKEIRSHSESISFPMEIKIGILTITFDAVFRNSISASAEGEARVVSAIREFEKFRNPLRKISGFIVPLLLLVVVWLSLSAIILLILSRFSPWMSDSRAQILPYFLVPFAFYLVYKLEKRGQNRLTRKNNDGFLQRYSDKIFPSVISSLLTAAAIWVFANWSSVKIALGLEP